MAGDDDPALGEEGGGLGRVDQRRDVALVEIRGLVDGDFVLTRFEFDPTYGDPLPDVPESYVVYEAGR